MSLLAPTVLMLLVSQAPDFSVEHQGEPEGLPPGHRFILGGQVGLGMQGDTAVGMARPRLGYGFRWDDGDGQLVVAPSLWGQWERDVTGEEITWLNRWHSADTYAAWVESLRLTFAQGRVLIEAAPLLQQSLGVGTLVNHLSSSLDGARPRTGAQVVVDLDTVRVEALTDSVVNPHVVGAHVAVAPLMWANVETTPRLWVFASGALDPQAPTLHGEAPFGGADLGLSYRLWSSQRVGFDVYTAAAVLSHPSVGGHLGTRLQLAPTSRSALSFELEGVAHSENYRPGVFDMAYQAERVSVAARAGRPRALLRPRDGFGLRGRFDLHLDMVRLGAEARSNLRGELSATAYVGVEVDRVTVSALWMERDMTRVEDLIDFDARTYAVLEAAVRAWDGFFAFTRLQRGWRIDEPLREVTPVTDWVLGVGYSGEAS